MELVEETIKSKVPIGSTKEEVLQYIKTASFKSLKFETPFQVTKVDEIKEAFPEADERANETITTWIDGVEKDFFLSTGIDVVFFLDSNQKVIDYRVRKGIGE